MFTELTIAQRILGTLLILTHMFLEYNGVNKIPTDVLFYMAVFMVLFPQWSPLRASDKGEERNSAVQVEST